MTRFRPCIDLHEGRVKQIVGGSLRDSGPGPRENFVATESAESFAQRYRQDGLTGGHVIKLGPGNDEAAKAALQAWPSGLQLGGGLNLENAHEWLDAGAEKLIFTSWLFSSEGLFLENRLKQLVKAIDRTRIVIDLSCRRSARGWTVAMNRWQTLTDLDLTHETLDRLANSCSEFLVHAADVEGLCQGIDEDLVSYLGSWGGIPMTYAGGVRDFSDIEKVNDLSQGRLDLTVGSALDLFGGNGVAYEDLLAWNRSA